MVLRDHEMPTSDEGALAALMQQIGGSAPPSPTEAKSSRL